MTLLLRTCPTRLWRQSRHRPPARCRPETDNAGAAPGAPKRLDVLLRYVRAWGGCGTSAVVPDHRGVEALGCRPRTASVEAMRAAQDKVARLGVAIVVGDGWEP